MPPSPHPHPHPPIPLGGLSNFFVDGEDGKPWSNTGTGAPYQFAMAKDEWYPSWAGRDSALQVSGSVGLWGRAALVDRSIVGRMVGWLVGRAGG